MVVCSNDNRNDEYTTRRPFLAGERVSPFFDCGKCSEITTVHRRNPVQQMKTETNFWWKKSTKIESIYHRNQQKVVSRAAEKFAECGARVPSGVL